MLGAGMRRGPGGVGRLVAIRPRLAMSRLPLAEATPPKLPHDAAEVSGAQSSSQALTRSAVAIRAYNQCGSPLLGVSLDP